jgi:5-methylthioadenosine/S-adenosylhomocysteine deaminase
VAHLIDQFLVAREGDVVRKLLALGGLSQEESFEVQVKFHTDDLELVENFLNHPEITVTKSSRFRQYDTYFYFDLPGQGQLRIREDIYLDDNEKPTARSRSRLTLTGEGTEQEYPHSVLLNRSRFTADADQSLRFYREYLNPSRELNIEKVRRRHRFLYHDILFAINIDRIVSPTSSGYFVEFKSRTWSQRDAENKAEMIGELLDKMGVRDEQLVKAEYSSMALES